MRNKRLTGGAARRACLIAVAAGLLPAAIMPAGSASAAPRPATAKAADPIGSAFGLAVIGPVAISPVPAVASSSTAPVSKSLLREGSTGLLTASALDVKAAADQAHSHIARLRVPEAALAAEAISATCTGATGTARLAGAAIAGTALDASPAPNSSIPVRLPGGLGTVAVTLNKQERLPDGRLRVTALAVDLPLAGKTEAIRVASATCGKPAAAAGSAVEAPAPVPVKSNLPVTG
ncbi:hypothetical protein J4573_18565 [Actinomadura barringtoniae]|uniref:Secreted protein n=1 Tax=Actinomadura barringtoniae TaxID=1427535 RepID=A0A939PG41_9ACTN|nr:choice-of-anchor P family protein [Actinomadura barringtoniae]MBO2449114.1 hypothetical protein [Actinomadura barringtoniae]